MQRQSCSYIVQKDVALKVFLISEIVNYLGQVDDITGQRSSGISKHWYCRSLYIAP